MKFILTIIGVLIMTSLCKAQSKHQFEYAKPEAKGYSSEKLEVLKKHLQESGSSSMIILVDGSVIFEWGEGNKKHLIHSMRKAILNSLYGIAISNGQIDTSMTMKELKIDDIKPGRSITLKKNPNYYPTLRPSIEHIKQRIDLNFENFLLYSSNSCLVSILKKSPVGLCQFQILHFLQI